MFVSELFLTVMAREKENIRSFMLQHLQELVEDLDLYGCEAVRAFHTIWLQQLE